MHDPAAAGTDVCPDICGQLPDKQRQAAGLAVSMVALTSCEGDIEGAARAVATAAADGDLSAFGAGLSVGAAVLAGETWRQKVCQRRLLEKLTASHLVVSCCVESIKSRQQGSCGRRDGSIYRCVCAFGGGSTPVALPDTCCTSRKSASYCNRADAPPACCQTVTM